jgi:hypothetical protein
MAPIITAMISDGASGLTRLPLGTTATALVIEEMHRVDLQGVEDPDWYISGQGFDIRVRDVGFDLYIRTPPQLMIRPFLHATERGGSASQSSPSRPPPFNARLASKMSRVEPEEPQWHAARSERGDVLAHQGQSDAALAGLEALHDDPAGPAVGQFQREGLSDRVLGAADVRGGTEVTRPRWDSAAFAGFGKECGGTWCARAVRGEERCRTSKGCHVHDAISRRTRSRIGSALDSALSIIWANGAAWSSCSTPLATTGHRREHPAGSAGW